MASAVFNLRFPKFLRVFVILPLVLIFPRQCLASTGDAPLWEVGMGLAGVVLPEYRGSSAQNTFLLPIPFLIYRGDFLRVDRQNVRGVFYDTSTVEFTISASVNPPVESDSGGVREGMPDLDPTFELGPMFRLFFKKGTSRDLSLRVPVRGVWTMDFSGPDNVGIISTPFLVFDYRDYPSPDWDSSFSLGLMVADSSYHSYYYQVAPEYSTFERPEYFISGGYSGARFLATLSRRFEKSWLGLFLMYEDLSEAEFKGSPLMEKNSSFSAGVGFSWIIRQSHRCVQEKL